MSAKVNWANVVKESVPIIQGFVGRGVIPTLRTVYYALVSKNLIPNTKSAYKRLSSVFVDARKKGVVSWHHIADETRKAEGGDRPLWTPEAYARAYVNYMFDQIKGFKLPLWLNQPYYVEVWIEKFALRATFDNFLNGKQVTLVPSRGYSSWTFLKDAAARIKDGAKGKMPIVLYFGDFDPSGEDIQRFLTEALRWFGVYADVIRIGVTPEQVTEYDLPSTPEDAEEIEKLERDPRFAKWEHGLYRVELDALLAYVPDEFERMVKESVEKYFDTDIARDVKEQERGQRKIARDEAFGLIDARREEGEEDEDEESD